MKCRAFISAGFIPIATQQATDQNALMYMRF
ncbi:hypothetical protein PM8797T_16730 [Gimesia maris DSM 8797]|nr:hypothetical protein PM8797T_16730 [Gimesia maris DSM 8797]